MEPGNGFFYCNAAVCNGFRCEVYVSLLAKSELGANPYALATVFSADREFTFPVSVIHCDLLASKTGILISQTVASTILRAGFNFGAIKLRPVASRPAKEVTICATVNISSSNLLPSFSSQAIKAISNVYLRYQAISNAVIFCPTNWLTLDVEAILEASESVHADHCWFIDSETVINVKHTISKHAADLEKPELTADKISFYIKKYFFGSENLIASISASISKYVDRNIDSKGSCYCGSAVIIGATGEGKTRLLHLFRSAVPAERALYIDVAKLIEYPRLLYLSIRICHFYHYYISRGVGEALMLALCNRIKASVILLLLDNIDACCIGSFAVDGARSISQLTQTSALRTLIDKILIEYPRCFILCSSSTRAFENESKDRTITGLDSSILQPYRIGASFHIQSLTFDDRTSVLMTLFRGSNISVVLDESAEVRINESSHNVEVYWLALARHMASRTQVNYASVRFLSGSYF